MPDPLYPWRRFAPRATNRFRSIQREERRSDACPSRVKILFELSWNKLGLLLRCRPTEVAKWIVRNSFGGPNIASSLTQLGIAVAHPL